MSGEYFPQNPNEKSYYEFLWNTANPSGEALGGKAAVVFFQRSGVDMGFLKQIWTLSTPLATMNIQQFFAALRYITMIQNGEFPISKDRLAATGKENLGLPKFNGIDIPKPAPAAPPAAAAAGGVNNEQMMKFAMNPTDHAKYHSLFLTYDTDKDGFLSQDEGMGIFTKSGLDANLLNNIWAMADDDRDRRLTPKEFCVGFHLILCIGKKGLPPPPTLPPPLKAFLVNAPAVPAGAAPMPHVTPPPAPVVESAPHAAVAPAVPPAAVPSPSSGGDAFSAFDSIGGDDNASTISAGEIAGGSNNLMGGASFAPVTPAPARAPMPVSSPALAPAPQQQYRPQPTTSTSSTATSGSGGNSEDTGALSNHVDSLRNSTNQALGLHTEMLDSSSRTASSLRGLREKLHQEKVVMEATLKSAQSDTQESVNKLDTLLKDVRTLQDQLGDLRKELTMAHAKGIDAASRTANAAAERSQLQGQIDQALKELSSLGADTVSISTQIGIDTAKLQESQTRIARINSQIDSNNKDMQEANSDVELLKSILGNIEGNKNQALQKVQALQVQSSSVSSQAAAAAEEERRAAQKLREVEANKARVQQERSNLISSAASNKGSISTGYVEVVSPQKTAFTMDSSDSDPFADMGKNDSSTIPTAPAPAPTSTSLPNETFSSSSSSKTLGRKGSAHGPDMTDIYAAADTFDDVAVGQSGDADPFGEISSPAADSGNNNNDNDPFGDVSNDNAFGSAAAANNNDEEDPFGAAAAAAASDANPYDDSDPFADAAAENNTVVSENPFGDEPTAPSPTKNDDEDASDPFADAGSSSTANDDPFADAGSSSTANDDPFADAGVGDADPFDSAAASKHDDGFGAASAFDAFGAGGDGSAAAPSATDAFGAPDSSFDAFGAASVAGGEDPFASAAGEGPAASGGAGDPFAASVGASDGFDAFGASDSAASGGGGFDAFADFN